MARDGFNNEGFKYDGASTTLENKRCVILDTSNEGFVLLPTAAGQQIAGISTETVDRDGAHTTIQTRGVAKVEAASAISIGDKVMVDGTSGKIKTAIAVFSTDLGVADTDVLWTAQEGDWSGIRGEDISIEYRNPNAGVVNASVVIDPSGANNSLTWEAKDAFGGLNGNDVTIEYRDPAANTQTLALVVEGTAIIVNLGTDGGGTITTTADLLKTALGAHPVANAMVTAVDEGADDGTGLVTAITATRLASGAGVPALSSALLIVVEGTAIIVNLATDSAGAISSTADLIKAAVAALAEAAAMVVGTDVSPDDGSGTVIALAAARLVGGHAIGVALQAAAADTELIDVTLLSRGN